MRMILLVCLLVVSTFLTGCLGDNITYSPGQHPQSIKRTVVKKVAINYLLYLPKDYQNSGAKWPLIMFLHGAGERGDDLDQVKAHGPAKLASQGKDLPFIVISPQCPKRNWWTNETDKLITLLDFITTRYNVDTSRVYLTGLSMGGYGTWNLAGNYPDRFAALAPICGSGDTAVAKYRLKDMPIWVFHGAKDKVVPLEKSQEMVDALKSVGSDVKFTIYPEAGHDSWTDTYDNPELYEWFLAQSKK